MYGWIQMTILRCGKSRETTHYSDISDKMVKFRWPWQERWGVGERNDSCGNATYPLAKVGGRWTVEQAGWQQLCSSFFFWGWELEGKWMSSTVHAFPLWSPPLWQKRWVKWPLLPMLPLGRNWKGETEGVALIALFLVSFFSFQFNSCQKDKQHSHHGGGGWGQITLWEWEGRDHQITLCCFHGWWGGEREGSPPTECHNSWLSNTNGYLTT